MKFNLEIKMKSKSWEFCKDGWYFCSGMPSLILENKEVNPGYYVVKPGKNQSIRKTSFKNIDIELSFTPYRNCFYSMTIDITNKGKSVIWVDKVKSQHLSLQKYLRKITKETD